MVQTQIDAIPAVSFSDKRRLSERQRNQTRIADRKIASFVTNAIGTTTTLVGANAAPATNDNNIARRGEKGRLFTSAGVLKEETVFEITAIAVAASTTLTITPAAAVATASGDQFRFVESSSLGSIEDMDSRLTTISATTFSPDRLAAMTITDKIKALQDTDDRDSGVFV